MNLQSWQKMSQSNSSGAGANRGFSFRFVVTVFILNLFLSAGLFLSSGKAGAEQPSLKSEQEVSAAHCPTEQQRPFNLLKISDSTYVRKGLHEVFTPQNFAAIANIGFIIGDKSVAVIDTGGSFCDGHRLYTALRAITDKPVSHVINTHTHPDHLFGNAAFINEKPEFIGHHNLTRALQDRGPIYLENLKRLMGEGQLKGTQIILPTKTVKTTETINLGNLELQLTAHETAHTNQDLTVFDPAAKIIWTGDLLFHEHIPVVDGSLLGWQQRMDELARIPATHAIPGHGQPMMEWPKALENQRAYLAALTRDLRKIIEDGGTMLEAQSEAASSEKDKWLLFEEFNARNASTGFAELEWE